MIDGPPKVVEYPHWPTQVYTNLMPCPDCKPGAVAMVDSPTAGINDALAAGINSVSYPTLQPCPDCAKPAAPTLTPTERLILDRKSRAAGEIL
jgi:hypothetical protein